MVSVRNKSITLSVLIYPEDDVWVAHALEMDVVECAAKPAQALERLRKAVVAQITFCQQKGISPLQPAPDAFFDLWRQLQAQDLERAAKIESDLSFSDRFARFLDFSLKDLTEAGSDRHSFQQAAAV